MTDVQSTSAMSAVDFYVAISSDGNTWKDISGTASSVTPSGGERVTGAGYTFAGDTPILKAGKRGPITVTVKCVYDENATNAFEVYRAIYETAGGACYVRWSPGGGDSGDFGYTTGPGIAKTPPYPSGDVTSGDPILFEFAMDCAVVTKSAIGTDGW